MAKCAYFVQECPTCGRSLHIRVEHLGKQVVCQHCRGQLLAHDRSAAPCEPPPIAPPISLLDRADELLDLASQRRNLPR